MNSATVDTTSKRHPIQVVARRLGLSIDVLRVWEKRYSLIAPARSEGGHRLYSDADIERLRLVREAMAGGRRVGQLAGLTNEQLGALIDEDRRETVVPPREGLAQQPPGAPESFVADCLQAVRILDSGGLKRAIDRAIIALPPSDFIEQVATPMMHKIGDLWHNGLLTPAHEHLASSVVRNALAEMVSALQPGTDRGRMVVATPAGQQHEIGAALVAATAQLEGWEVTYLGSDLPAIDIAQAGDQIKAEVIALSITVAPEINELAGELEKLRRSVPTKVHILVGGQAADAIQTELSTLGTRYTANLALLQKALREISQSAD